MGYPPAMPHDPSGVTELTVPTTHSGPTGSGGPLTHPDLRPSDYQLGGVIGRGGMGEVLVARDRRLGREVALKRMLTPEPTADEVSAFLREARIQARLDHPAIVPVFELGHDGDGRPFFSMKRLEGVTLHDRLVEGGPTQPLLRAFVDVCLAVDLAHSKGIVHRDLKPTNIMLGEFGEVYILDWGIAVILDDPDADATAVSPAASGAGTPGYMAPEQVYGGAGPAADVYSLGCILFEILTAEPLAPRTTAAVTRHATVDSAAHRRPDLAIAPELDALCLAALQPVPGDRPSARELATQLERYLDGDRDLERRRGLAVEQLVQAETALAAGDRVLAMRAGGSALALDPTSPHAAALVTRLLLEPPAVPSPELGAELRASDAIEVRRHARRAALAYLAVVPLSPLAMWNGVKDWTLLLVILGSALVLATLAWRLVARPHRPLHEMVIYLCGTAALVAVMSRVFGPFTLVPALACLLTSSLMAYPAFAPRAWLVTGCIAVGWLLPLAAELAGAIARTWRVGGDGLVSVSRVLEIHGTVTLVLVMTSSFATILIAGYLSGSQAKGHFEAKRQLLIQAWHLKLLLPPVGAERSGQAPAQVTAAADPPSR
jgi:hypothetical protein